MEVPLDKAASIKNGLDAILGKEEKVMAAVVPDTNPVPDYNNRNNKTGGKITAAPNQNNKAPLIRGIKGLSNLGNTCFFNSVMQSIVQTRGMIEHFIGPDQMKDFSHKLNVTLVHPEGALSGSLRRFMSAHWSVGIEINRTHSPVDFFKEFIKKATHFSGYKQHDAQELLRCVLDALIVEEETIIKKVKNQRPSVDKSIQEATQNIKNN
jgi:ubiquitin C-terminal hydrolase